ncbi:hypothetical protein OG2516_18840 [Oceanicola granulosus HTCC2516]|uniref:Glycosyltransferase 2-like domain-containing protein n=1 Tax=Oceanicola granulosus (strain ATCC BAA-861 / DSM 15982 / KCTC 12143 / HTCC2516) TaxID=314256 RepID=Q2C9V0_OCEGH|nr:glycosyltransferase family 2 protein [Oceanicola granulosus]EAR49448.1 hypothetical protein OG2516_18840 [Oceanicola granulosus HTCC2516]
MSDSLALVVPARNDHAGLARLLAGAAATGCVAEAVVVDDASDPPLAPAPLRRAARGLPLTLLRQPRPRGAGAARNRALASVRASHLLYVDADDLVTPALPRLWADLRGRAYDFCHFRHAESGLSWRGAWGMPAQDEMLWAGAGLSAGALAGPLDTRQRAALAQTANYPWNKIYRTDFLRAHGLVCSETMVHNDIELHWASYADAETVLAADRPAVMHHFAARGGRLTNRTGIERLAAFVPLERLAARLVPEAPLALPYLRFASHFLAWVRANMRPELHPRFDRRTGHFVRRHIDAAGLARIARADPVLGLRLTLMGAL